MAELAAAYPFLDAANVDRIARAYGREAWAWLGDARSADDLGEAFGGGLTAREVDWLVAQEWARTPEDILWRRTKTGLEIDPAGMDGLAAYLAFRND